MIQGVLREIQPRQYKAKLSLGRDLRLEMGVENCPLIQTAQDIADIFNDLSRQTREVLVVGTLNCKCRLMFWSIVSVGSSDGLAVRIGDAFFGAVHTEATGIFLVHNHPSGSLDPSDADLSITKKFAKAGLLLGYSLFDHVIVSKKGHRSILSPRVLEARVGMSVIPAKVRYVGETSSRVMYWSCSKCKARNEVRRAVSTEALLCSPATCKQCTSFCWLKAI